MRRTRRPAPSSHMTLTPFAETSSERARQSSVELLRRATLDSACPTCGGLFSSGTKACVAETRSFLQPLLCELRKQKEIGKQLQGWVAMGRRSSEASVLQNVLQLARLAHHHQSKISSAFRTNCQPLHVSKQLQHLNCWLSFRCFFDDL